MSGSERVAPVNAFHVSGLRFFRDVIKPAPVQGRYVDIRFSILCARPFLVNEIAERQHRELAWKISKGHMIMQRSVSIGRKHAPFDNRQRQQRIPRRLSAIEIAEHAIVQTRQEAMEVFLEIDPLLLRRISPASDHQSCLQCHRKSGARSFFRQEFSSLLINGFGVQPGGHRRLGFDFLLRNN